jgi:hypothetical protein
MIKKQGAKKKEERAGRMFFAHCYLLIAIFFLMAGCVDIIKAPPEAFDPTDGQLVITIGSGLERTVFPQLDQFSKITLSFEKKDGAGSKEDEEVSLGETLINLTPGTWELTAAAYNNAEPPAVVARAVNTLTRAGDLITGDTYFALAPAGTGPGVLSYKITPPGGIALDAAQSRIRIEQDGVVLGSLNSGSFTAGVRTISGAVNGTLSLEPGRYAVDIVLDDSKSVNTAVFRGAAAILPGLVTEIVFSPMAGDFLDPDVRLALTGTAAFGLTRNNTSDTKIGSAGGQGANRTMILPVPRGTGTVYFTLGKTGTQTISLDAGAADKVVWAESGNVDGSIASGTRPVFTVDTGDLVENGGDQIFVISLAEPGKTPLVYTVTIALPYLTKIIIDQFPKNFMYMQGDSLDLTGIQLTGIWSDLTKTLLTAGQVDANGFDSSSTGDQYLTITKNGVISDKGFTVTVRQRESRLFFYHGMTSAYEELVQNPYYTVPNGRTLVLAPVLWLIPDNAVYEWDVDDVVQNGYDTEYFPYTGTASSGTHTITVTAKVEGVPIASANTTVVSAGGANKREKTPTSGAGAKKLYSVVAPGQFGSSSGRLGDLHGFGGFGGYAVFEFDHSVEKKGADGEEILIGGNAFGNWNEPGAIWVSQDENNNGEPDDTWYELKGSHTLAPETLRRNAVTFIKRNPVVWTDNMGSVGTCVELQAWPSEAPAGLTEFTLVGTCLNISATYDSTLAGYADVVDNGRVSLSNAIQADGTSVDLPFIDFLKIVTAFNYGDPTFGERSTEAKTPTDRFMPDPNKLITGKDLENGTYEYSFTNNSGYALTVEFNGTEFVLNDGDTAVKVSGNFQEQIDYYGGNAYLSNPAVGQVFFTAGPDV